MTKKLIATFGFAILFAINTNAARDIRRSQRIKNINISGTTTSIKASVADTTITSKNYTIPAPITDAVAKRNCTNLVIKGLKNFCGKTKCKNATEAYAGIILPSVNDKEPNEIYCANFIEEAVNNLWNSYDSYALNEQKNCNIALSRSLVAEACYRYVLTMQNQKIIINQTDLNEFCGKDAIKAQYKQISNGETIKDNETGDDLTSYFSNVGNIGWSNLTSYTRLLDGKIDFKTTEFPRDLIQLVNSLRSQGNMMCGEKNYTELYDSNIQLIEKEGSIERRIKEKGLLSGGKDWIMDQIEVFTGNKEKEENKE